MKIEEFKKFKQLDRIEFLLLKNKYVGDYPSSETIGFIILIVPLFMLLVIMGLLLYIINGSLVLLWTLPIFTNYVKIVIILLVIIDIASIFFHIRKSKRFDKQFTEDHKK